jgi:XXXCH domain-containing protein
MGSSEKRKIEMTIAPDEVADFFKSLAQDLEGGSLHVDDASISLEGFKSIEIGLKKTGEGLKVKVKVKTPATPFVAPGLPAAVPAGGEAAPAEARPDGKPRYSTLKKWMKKEFKAIREALALGQMPDPDLAESFVADSLLMCSYPGKGDEFYPAYTAQAEAFGAAVKAGDLVAAQTAVAGLDALKRDCHDRYK